MNDHPFPYDLTHTTMPDPMPPTQLTDAMLKKPGFSPSEWIESHRSLEEAAQGLRDALDGFIDLCNRHIPTNQRIDGGIIGELVMAGVPALSALARFDALKEAK